MKLETLVATLAEKLNHPLPGMDAHRLMMPGEINTARFDEGKMKLARLSSVLVMFYEKNGEVHFPLTQRNEYDGTHSGQVSFPGGKWEEGDPDLIHTAKREANEEIGIEPEKVEIIGQLSDLFIPPSNFKVSPYISVARYEPQFVLDPIEVKELIEVPLSRLLDEDVVKHKDIVFANGFTLNAPYFAIEHYTVWGATAMMLSELVEVIKS